MLDKSTNIINHLMYALIKLVKEQISHSRITLLLLFNPHINNRLIDVCIKLVKNESHITLPMLINPHNYTLRLSHVCY